MSEKVEFKKIREFGEIINDTFLFIKQNFKPLMKAFIYLCGFFVLAAMISAVIQQINMQKVLTEGVVFRSDTNPVYSQLSKVFTVQYFITVAFLFANYTAIHVAVFSYIALYVEKGKVAPKVEEVWAYFRFYFFRVLGSSLVVTVFMIFCFAACIVPGVYVFPAMSLFYPIMIMENADLGYAFSRSFKLLKEQWWVTAATIFVLWLITYCAMTFISMPATLLQLFSTLVQGQKQVSTAIIIGTTVSQQLAQVFMIIPAIGTTFCYFNLMERQENTGLLSRIDQLGKEELRFDDKPEEY